MRALVVTAILAATTGIAAPGAQSGRQHALPAGRLPHGATVATLSIPRLAFVGVVHQGIDADVLALGPGHYPTSSLPGRPGTVAFAGHRVTHTHPFLHINLLRRGDVITVATRRASFRYRVYRERIVAADDVTVLRPVGFQQLVLTACHPPHTALKRYVVFARRIG